MKVTNYPLIREMHRHLEAIIASVVPPGSPYALVDFPDHSNVGDSAIWLGELALLQAHCGYPPSYVSRCSDFSVEALATHCPEGPILIHGGGNFGDIWMDHQTLREKILSAFPGRSVVQLPQSIHFRDKENVASARRAIVQHGAFVLMVRDRRSLAFANDELGCDAILAPDCAIGMGTLNRPLQPDHKTVFLLRTDKEQMGYERTLFEESPSSMIVDWLEEPAMPVRASRLVTLLRQKLTRSGQGGMADFQLFKRLATMRLDRGLRILAHGEFVVTDRLHAHILSFLMDIPHVTLDNDYGKVSGFIEAWTAGSDRVRVATTPVEAMHALAQFEHGSVI